MGLLNKNAYPNWRVAALATANPAYINGPTQGCGYIRARCMASFSVIPKQGDLCRYLSHL